MGIGAGSVASTVRVILELVVHSTIVEGILSARGMR